MTPLLQIRDLTKAYGPRPVFEALSFAVAAGDRLVVLGVSGSGKSTLLRLLAGLDRPTGGRIERAPGLRIGMVFQDLALWPNLTALQNVALALPHLPARGRRGEAQAALASCRVPELGPRKPATLSIGQQQRVALARAIAARPQLLLLDEPFSSLDPLLRDELTLEITRIATGTEVALVMVTHDPLEALSLGSNALVLEDGHLAESGELTELLLAPQSQLLRHFAAQLGQVLTLRPPASAA